jgi:hypothetical protein
MLVTIIYRPVIFFSLLKQKSGSCCQVLQCPLQALDYYIHARRISEPLTGHRYCGRDYNLTFVGS